MDTSAQEGYHLKSSKKNHQFYIDDWGLSPEINQAVLNLARLGVVAGVSVLVDLPYVNDGLDKLLTFEKIKIGLHFNLTESDTHWASFIRNRSLIEAEIHRQHEKLMEVSRRIDYIDGHHHIHLLPIVSKYVERFSTSHRIPIRLLDDPSHPGSYLLTKAFRLKARSSDHFVCSYLTPYDLKKNSRLHLKLLRSRTKPLVIHVSAESESKGSASAFESFRRQQYLRILDHLRDQI